jgi:DNA-binding CsgD family transcriptional regulator
MESIESNPSLQHVVNGIYDAALEPGLWPEVISNIGAYCRSSFAMLSWRDRARSEGPLALRIETRLSELVDEYFKGLVMTDPMIRIVDGPVDVPTLNEYWEPRQEFLTSERYKLVHRPAGVDDRACVLVLRGDHEVNATITVARGPKEDRYDSRALVPLRELSPHVRRALQVTHRCRGDAEHRESLIATLNRVEDGIFFVDATNRIVFSNDAAERLLKRQVLTVRNGRLAAPLDTESIALDTLLKRVTKTGDGSETDPGGRLSLHGADGELCATVVASPLRTSHINERFGPKPVRAAVFVRERIAFTQPGPEMLRTLFSLTPAELHLAQGLGNGLRLQEIADGRGVSKETMRSQLSSIFNKTGVRRQSDLIKVLLTAQRTWQGGDSLRN